MPGTVDELALVAALHTGDEAVFAELVDQHSPSMLRVARGYVPSHEIAEEVVQETWIALLKGISKGTVIPEGVGLCQGRFEPFRPRCGQR